MNRGAFGAVVFVMALTGPAAASARAQVLAPASRGVETSWQAERAFHLNRVMERARATMAGRAASEKTLAGLEALVSADAKRTRPAKTVKDIAALRTRVYQALNNLDAASVRFDNGMLTAWERDAMYHVVVLLVS